MQRRSVVIGALALVLPAACGGGSGGSGGGTPEPGQYPLAGSWLLTSTYSPLEDSLLPPCEGPLGLESIELSFAGCAPCESGFPDVRVYLGTSTAFGDGDLTAGHFPASGSFSLTGPVYLPATDRTLQFGGGESQGGSADESGFQCVEQVTVYAGDVIVHEPIGPNEELVYIDPEAEPLCEGLLHLDGVRPSALELGRAEVQVGGWLGSAGSTARLSFTLDARAARLELALHASHAAGAELDGWTGSAVLREDGRFELHRPALGALPALRIEGRRAANGAIAGWITRIPVDGGPPESGAFRAARAAER